MLSEYQISILMNLANKAFVHANDYKMYTTAKTYRDIWGELYDMREKYRASVSSLKEAHNK